uniref:C2H2-type domain-containing protein n=1 Tax=Strongyloides papillosus TaxID=174720 RepID=A0A0N5BNJ3_STREA
MTSQLDANAESFFREIFCDFRNGLPNYVVHDSRFLSLNSNQNDSQLQIMTGENNEGTSQIGNFISQTVNEINIMLHEYKSRDTPLNNDMSLRIPVSIDGNSTKIKINLHLNENKNFVKCAFCKREVKEDYASRREHVFKRHLSSIKYGVRNVKDITKTDVLFSGFLIIQKCFPNSIVCTDFQCLSCGMFYKSKYWRKNHIASYHQKDFVVQCPWNNCAFQSGSGVFVREHLEKQHLSELVDCQNGVASFRLEKFLESRDFIKFDDQCRIEDEINNKLLIHYFPVSEKYYKHFDEDFTCCLETFKKKHLNHLLNKNTKTGVSCEYEPERSKITRSNDGDSNSSSRERRYNDSRSGSHSRGRRYTDSRSSDRSKGRKYTYSVSRNRSRERRFTDSISSNRPKEERYTDSRSSSLSRERRYTNFRSNNHSRERRYTDFRSNNHSRERRYTDFRSSNLSREGRYTDSGSSNLSRERRYADSLSSNRSREWKYTDSKTSNSPRKRNRSILSRITFHG